MSKLKAKKPENIKPAKTKGVLFGASGVGKTWFSLDFPAPYYIDCENGATRRHYVEKLNKSGGAYLGQEDGSNSFDIIMQQIEALATEKHLFKTLVIDSITKIYQSCIATEQERLKGNDVFGASKKPAIANMRRLVNWITRLDMNVWFIAHEAVEWGPDGKGGRMEIGKIPDAWDKLIYELDITLRLYRIGNTYPPKAIVHKSRLEGFTLGECFDLTYNNFANKYGKDAIESNVDLIEICTADQLADITHMIDLLKIPTDDVDKILSKANANELRELTKQQASSTIEWLNSKIKKGAQ